MSFLQPALDYGSQGFLAAVNFAIERDDELHDAMRGLAGKTLAFRLDIPGVFNGLSFYGRFAADGLLEDLLAEPGPRPESSFTAQPSLSHRSVPVADVSLWLSSDFFSSTMSQTLQALRPTQDAPGSNDLGIGGTAAMGPSALRGIRIEGDAALAQRLVPLLDVLRSRVTPLQLAISSSPLARMAQKAVHYLVYDAGVLVTKPELADHAKSVRSLRERIDRLEKRVNLSSR